MGPGAIIVVGSDQHPFGVSAKKTSGEYARFSEPLACADILGRTVIERMIERLLQAGVETVSVLVASDVADSVRSFSSGSKNVRFKAVTNLPSAVSVRLAEFTVFGIEHSFVLSANVYAETDLLDLFYFHSESLKPVTCSFDREGPLDLWVVNCAQAHRLDYLDSPVQDNSVASTYFVREYVKRFAHLRDLRQFAVDVLHNRCQARPSGREVRPGIWVDEGAEIHRLARVVAPAFIGRRSKVQQDALVTRGGTIEKDCCIDCGTVIENSSILSDTHVGIWLDVCYAVVAGNLFLSLKRDVAQEILDPAIIRVNNTLWKTKGGNSGLSHWDVPEPVVPEPQPIVALQPHETKLEKPPASKAWQLGANPIQG